MNKQVTEWEKIFTIHITDKGQKAKNPKEKRAKDLNRHVTKEDR